LYDCTAPCFPNREENLRRKRGRSRGRAEINFDFYDAWDDEETGTDSLVGWGNDELDSLLAGRGSQPDQPRRPRAMSYGSRGRRKTSGGQVDSDQDPTIIPSSSYLGFLERLPWKIGSRKLRYKPSAADLQENPGGTRIREVEAEPLIEEPEEEQGRWNKSHGRQRSDTVASRSTNNSLSSRGDLIMSDEEDDAVPLDDEFAAVMLSRRMTNQGSTEDQSSGKSRSGSGKRPGASRRSTRTVSTKSLKSPSTKSPRSASQQSLAPLSPTPAAKPAEPPSMLDLRRHEERVEREEELEIQQKREAAQRLAVQRGLSSRDVKSLAATEIIPDTPDSRDDETAGTAEEDTLSLTDPRLSSSQELDPTTTNRPEFLNETDPKE